MHRNYQNWGFFAKPKTKNHFWKIPDEDKELIHSIDRKREFIFLRIRFYVLFDWEVGESQQSDKIHQYWKYYWKERVYISFNHFEWPQVL